MSRKAHRAVAGLLPIIGLVGLVVLVGGAAIALTAFEHIAAPWDDPAPTATMTPEPIVPTRTPSAAARLPTETPTRTPAPTPTPTPTGTPTQPPAEPTGTPTNSPTEPPPPSVVGGEWFDRWIARPRWGIGVAAGPISRYAVGPLRLGWYLDWRAQPQPPRPGGAAYAQMIRLSGGQLHPDAETIAAIAQANPGSLWLVGNEPDVKWQDNVAPETYARLYHEAHQAIKGADPTAAVAIGGVSQPTPLRLRYLEMVLDSYRAQFGADLPLDVWNVHNFTLREERDSWGVDIPPDLADDTGLLYEVDDSGNLDAFRRQIADFRRWMARMGYRNYPLIVSEYGILMPADYGFPPERVAEYLTATFDFFLTATDGATGYPADGDRLVQFWCWYSLDAPADYYPTGNLFDPQSGALTALGHVWSEYVAAH